MKKFERLLDVLELYLPMVLFVVMFISYIVLIAYRYVFYAAIQWLNELSIITYSWSIIFASSYCERKGLNVSFSVVYDKLPERAQLIMRLIGNTFIAVTFAILLPYAYDFVNFMSIRKTPVMKVPFNIVYMPFVFFVVMTLLHLVVKIVKDVLKLTRGKNVEKGGSAA